MIFAPVGAPQGRGRRASESQRAGTERREELKAAFAGGAPAELPGGRNWKGMQGDQDPEQNAKMNWNNLHAWAFLEREEGVCGQDEIETSRFGFALECIKSANDALGSADVDCGK